MIDVYKFLTDFYSLIVFISWVPGLLVAIVFVCLCMSQDHEQRA